MRTEGWLLILLASSMQAQEQHVWEFPNFSDRLQIVVTNPHESEFEGVAMLSIPELKKIDPAFPGTLLLAAEDATPDRQTETQIDAQRNEFAMDVHLYGHESKTYSVYYSSTLKDQLSLPAHVHASHNYGYNHATASIESELIGYRTYGGAFLDVQAHAKGERGLFNAMLGYSSITHPPAEGQDVIHLGDTLGLGGIFLRSGNDIYRPPVSTPDYTHRLAKGEEPQYQVIAEGPIRAIIEETLPVWSIGDDRVSLRVEYEMDAGQEVVHCHWWITPIKIARQYEVGAGIRDLDADANVEADHLVTTSGTQPDSNGRIALGIRWNDEAQRSGRLKTQEADNEAIVFRRELTADRPAEGVYTVAAGWQGSGWNEPAKHVKDVLRSQSESVSVNTVRHESNPKPKVLDKEPK